MKVFICLFALAAAANAVPLLSSGSSTQSRSQDAAGNYAFAYNEQHATGGSSRSEQGNHGGVVGSYSLNVADGRQRVVKYVADGHGFRAAIATNEPGTAAQPAAATSISSPYLPPQAPIAIAEPVAVAHAPVAYASAYAPSYAVGHAAPVLAHAPLAVAHAVVPAVSSYSSAVNHAVAGVHAPLLAPAHSLHGPVLAAPALGYKQAGYGLW